TDPIFALYKGQSGRNNSIKAKNFQRKVSTMFKIDIFVPIPRPFDESAQARARIIWTGDPPTQQIRVASPEDIIVQKLVWFQMGGEISERQWLDVQAVLKVQGSELDQAYLRQWAVRLGIEDLMVRRWKRRGCKKPHLTETV
ncbi:MAG: hypothetical protein HY326_05255, partial [Chloroflexi bacterium]|nr:hypothetical protein [Chloroflexota bacterium]